MSDDTDERLTAIEEKVAYMEKTVGDLDGVMRDLSVKVEMLLTQVKRLSGIERVIAEREAPADEKPPHY
jgi:uncharacterized coiled-coil protein SlyX